MHFIFRLGLISALLVIVVHCQGARGGSRGGSSSGIRGGSRGTIRTSGGSTCQGDNCKQSGVIVGSVIGGLFGTLAVIFGTVYCYRRWKRRSMRSSTVFAVSGTPQRSQTYEKVCFETGIWSSRYCQYNKWHGPYQLSLLFDRTLSKVNGHGTDDVGAFVVDGMYSSETQQITLTKVYKQGTGDPTENFGHTVAIQLTWNSNHNQFEGKWLVQTSNYHGEDKFELKFEKNAEIFIKEMKF